MVALVFSRHFQWWLGVVVNGIGDISQFALCQTLLVLRWDTFLGYIVVGGMA